MKRMELRFFSSQRVPRWEKSSVSRNFSYWPGLQTETFTSARIWPFSMSPPHVPRLRRISRSVRTKAAAAAGERMCGLETISISATPARFRST